MAGKVIFKYALDFRLVDTIIELPLDSKVLHVDAQRGHPMLWALVDPEPGLATQRRRFAIVATGQVREDLDERWYIGTFLLEDGLLVLHLFEIK